VIAFYVRLACTGKQYGMITDTPPLPEFELHDGDTLRLGDLAFDVLHTPGHSPGHVCLHEKVRAACTAPLLAPLLAAAVLVVVPRATLAGRVALTVRPGAVRMLSTAVAHISGSCAC